MLSRTHRPRRSPPSTTPRSTAPTASRLPPDSTAAARDCAGSEWWSWPRPEGVPVADRGQAAALLHRGTRIETASALFEVVDDALPVIDRVVVVVFELGL